MMINWKICHVFCYGNHVSCMLCRKLLVIMNLFLFWKLTCLKFWLDGMERIYVKLCRRFFHMIVNNKMSKWNLMLFWVVKSFVMFIVLDEIVGVSNARVKLIVMFIALDGIVGVIPESDQLSCLSYVYCNGWNCGCNTGVRSLDEISCVVLYTLQCRIGYIYRYKCEWFTCIKVAYDQPLGTQSSCIG